MVRKEIAMKRIALLLLVLLIFSTFPTASAEIAVNVEVMKVDGISVVVLTPDATMLRARGVAEAAEDTSITLPQMLTMIEGEAFVGIDAASVEISGNVVSIGPRAFSDCPNLREFHIPDSVLEIDETALAGCTDVTVYGSTDVAKAFAEANGFRYEEGKEEGTGEETEDQTGEQTGDQTGEQSTEKTPVTLPFVPAR